MHSGTYTPTGLPKYTFPGDAPTWDETNQANEIINTVIANIEDELSEIPRAVHLSATPQQLANDSDSFTLTFVLSDTKGTSLDSASAENLVIDVRVDLADYSYGYVQYFISSVEAADGNITVKVTTYNNAKDASDSTCQGTMTVSGITIKNA